MRKVLLLLVMVLAGWPGTAQAASPTVVRVALGSAHTCVVMRGGTVDCWGSNLDAELGTGHYTDRPRTTPGRVPGLTGVTALAAGNRHSCAIVAGGTLTCWGTIYYGELGVPAKTGRYQFSKPVRVPGLTGVVSVAAGDAFTCAVLRGGTVDCFGEASDGQLGRPVPMAQRSRTGAASGPPVIGTPTPRPVPGVSGATAVAAGDAFACALLRGGTVDCWGNDEDGQLGNGRNNTFDVPPRPVKGLRGVRSISAGSTSVCAVTKTDAVWCWGENLYGNLGDGSATDRSRPVRVVGLGRATAVAVGYSHSCAVLVGGGIRCWGEGGTLGDGTATGSRVPVAVAGIGSATAVAAGAGGGCALTRSHQLWCWGYNRQGSVGDGTTTDALAPVRVLG